MQSSSIAAAVLLVTASVFVAAQPSARSGTATPKQLAQGAPTITSISPASGSLGTPVTIGGTGFATSNTVSFKGATRSFSAGSPTESTDGVTLRFAVDPCPAHAPKCPYAFIPDGPYEVTVDNVNGTSKPVIFKLTNR
jgi:hypothetical protein